MKKIQFETFRKIGAYEIGNLRFDHPSCFNGSVSVKKYRVTIEEVEETEETVKERLKELWAGCNNHHHWDPLRREAEKYGLTLEISNVGKKRKP